MKCNVLKLYMFLDLPNIYLNMKGWLVLNKDLNICFSSCFIPVSPSYLGRDLAVSLEHGCVVHNNL